MSGIQQRGCLARWRAICALRTYSLGGKDYVTYDIEPKGGKGKIEYTLILKDGVVVDVTYLNSGNFFGVTQHEAATELQRKGI
jgi:hypothetical protein